MAKKYIFPFNEIEQGAKIVLLGCNEVARDYAEQIWISGYAKLIAWTYLKTYLATYKGYGIIPFEVAMQLDFDYIVICEETDIADYNEVISQLHDKGIGDSNIVVSSFAYYEDYIGGKFEWGLFPFESVLPGSRVVIYGAGHAGKICVQQINITHYAEIVAIVDKSYDRLSQEAFEVLPPQRVPELNFDYVVVAISKSETAYSIRDYMIAELGIDADKIIISEHILYDSERLHEEYWDGGEEPIGIANIFWWNNPGCVLSAYALQRFINRKCNKDVYVLNYTEESKKAPVPDSRMVIRGEKYDEFREKYVVSTPRFHSFSSKILHKNYSAVISTIDAWRPDLARREVSYFYFLRFQKAGKRIGYAVSLATEDKSAFEPYNELYRSLTEDFDYIFVREKGIVDFIHEVSHCDVSDVVDAVFLLEKEDYDVLLSKGMSYGEKYLYLYALTPTPEIIQFAQSVAKEKGLVLVYDLRMIENETIFQNVDGVASYDAGPNDFLRLIKDAEYVITDSFHALSFSVIFEKEFYVFGRMNAGVNISGRMTNLLKSLELDRRFNCERIDETNIDYDSVNALLHGIVDESQKKLINAIAD